MRSLGSLRPRCSMRGARLLAGSVVAALELGACGSSGSVVQGADAELRDRDFAFEPLDLVVDEAASEVEGQFVHAELGAFDKPSEPGANATVTECDDEDALPEACTREFRRRFGQLLQTRLGRPGPNAVPVRFRLRGEESKEWWVVPILAWYLSVFGVPVGRDSADVTLELEVAGRVHTGEGHAGGRFGLYYGQGDPLHAALADAIEAVAASLRAPTAPKR
jgi:hypothetical protein